MNCLWYNIVLGDPMTICTHCGTEFTPAHFNQTKYCSHKCSYSSFNKKLKQRKEANIDLQLKIRQQSSESYHRQKNKEINIKHYLIKYAKARANKKGLEFNITKDDIELPEFCPILQVKLSKDSRRYGYSLDRINPKLGYIKGNIWVISQLANSMKWDSTEEERLLFANWVYSSQKGNLLCLS